MLAAAFGLATVGAFLGLSHRRRTLLGFVLVGCPGGLVEHHPPSNDRDWQPDVAVLPSATDGDRVTLHNIRNSRTARPRISPRGITTKRSTCGAWTRRT